MLFLQHFRYYLFYLNFGSLSAISTYGIKIVLTTWSCLPFGAPEVARFFGWAIELILIAAWLKTGDLNEYFSWFSLSYTGSSHDFRSLVWCASRSPKSNEIPYEIPKYSLLTMAWKWRNWFIWVRGILFWLDVANFNSVNLVGNLALLH